LLDIFCRFVGVKIFKVMSEEKPEFNIPSVIGSCFCGKPAIVYAFDTYFCQHHNDELAKSFEARMKMPDNDFDGGGGA
jgi:hypothetical protein